MIDSTAPAPVPAIVGRASWAIIPGVTERHPIEPNLHVGTVPFTCPNGGAASPGHTVHVSWDVDADAYRWTVTVSESANNKWHDADNPIPVEWQADGTGHADEIMTAARDALSWLALHPYSHFDA